MEYAEFKRHVSKAELLANRDFTKYKSKVALFAILGYVAIFAVIFMIVVIFGGLVWGSLVSTAILILLIKKKIIFILLPMLWIMIRSLWVKIEAPSGYEMTRARFPELFSELDRLSEELDSLKIHKVLLTQEMNAAVIQSPRLGILGWQQNTLILGLELLLALSPQQARAVVAHELGHLSGNHSKFHGWIYRVRESWSRILNSLAEQDSLGSRMMGGFFNWYAPRFAAYSFPLARFNEYEADAMSAELTSAKAAADALVNVHVVSPYLDEHYWQTFFKRADSHQKPEVLPWEGLHEFLQTNQDSKIDDRFDAALKLETDVTDTHPSLRDRLAALEVEPVLPEYTETNAVQTWLGDEYQPLIKEFDQLWFKQNHAQWRERYEYASESKQALKELRKSEIKDLSDDELWRLGTLESEFGGQPKAVNAFREYRQRKPDDPASAYALGYFMYEAGHEACIPLFEQSLSSNDYAMDACGYAFQFLSDNGRASEAEQWRVKADAIQNRMHEAYLEREQLNPSDKMRRADLDNEFVVKVINRLKISSKVTEAWVAEKVVEQEAGQAAIAVAVKTAGLVVSETKLQTRLAGEFEDLGIWVIPHSGDFKPLAKAIMDAGDQVI